MQLKVVRIYLLKLRPGTDLNKKKFLGFFLLPRQEEAGGGRRRRAKARVAMVSDDKSR